MKTVAVVPYRPATVGKDKAALDPPLPAAFKGGAFGRAPLLGASVPQVYCGHGQDSSFPSNRDHTCFD